MLDDITVTLERGRVHGFVGRNGSGKTVLMKCIAGLARPDSGEVLVDGRHIGTELENPPDMGAIIEVPGFLPNASGYRNLKYLADISGRAGDKEIRAAMEKCGLDPDSRKWVSKYSLGMRQRLGIAQAIMEDPSLLILDEPMNGLDDTGVLEARRLPCRPEGKGQDHHPRQPRPAGHRHPLRRGLRDERRQDDPRAPETALLSFQPVQNGRKRTWASR